MSDPEHVTKAEVTSTDAYRDVAPVEVIPVGPRIHPALILGISAFVGSLCLVHLVPEWSSLSRRFAISGALGVLVAVVSLTRLSGMGVLAGIGAVLRLKAIGYSDRYDAVWAALMLASVALSLASATRSRALSRSFDATNRTVALCSGWLAVIAIAFIAAIPYTHSLLPILPPAFCALVGIRLVARRDGRIRAWLASARAGNVLGWKVNGDLNRRTDSWIFFDRYFDRLRDLLDDEPRGISLISSATGAVVLAPREPKAESPGRVGFLRGAGRAMAGFITIGVVVLVGLFNAPTVDVREWERERGIDSATSTYPDKRESPPAPPATASTRP